MQDWELSFSNFIDSDCKEYDRAYGALLSLTRKAFKEGWLAAGGTLPNNPQTKQVWCPECGRARDDSEDN